MKTKEWEIYLVSLPRIQLSYDKILVKSNLHKGESKNTW